MKILLLDIYERKIFDLYNILRIKYFKNIILCSFEKNNLSTFFGKIIYNKSIYYIDKKNFIISLNNLINYHYPNQEIIIFPTEESTMKMFLDNRNKINNKFKFLFPNKYVFELVRDKKSLNDFCVTNKIPVPREFKLNDIKNLKSYLPLIAKPKIGSGSRGIFHINSYKDFNIFKKRFYKNEKFIIQEKIGNEYSNILGCFLLCFKGKVINYYSHKRIRTYPKSGGVTTHSIISKNVKLYKSSKKIIKKLNYSGLIMIEYLHDIKDDKYKLIEINPRIWGSILASSISNSNLIENYINISLKLKVQDYKFNKSFITWLFPYEVKFLFSHIYGRLKYGKYYGFINISKSKIFSSFFFHLYVYVKKAFKKL